MKVYIVFDPAGIWEIGDAVYADRFTAETVVTAQSYHYPGYRLTIREYDVVSGAAVRLGSTPPD